jgi:hypothetical protein
LVIRKLSLLTFLFLSFLGEGFTTDITIRVTPINTSLTSGEAHPFQIKTLRFYLSEITFMNGKDTVWTEPEGYRLIDLADSSSFHIASYVPDGFFFDAIRFRLGVDSVSSSTGAHTGALDPAYGMYWAWHTGYVNLKIEGTCHACPPPKNDFEFHIGGFQSPFNAERVITLKASNNNLEIFFDLANLLKEAFSSNQFRIMTPGAAAMRMADNAAKSFYIRP